MENYKVLLDNLLEENQIMVVEESVRWKGIGIIAHGIASFLKESNMERSDKFEVQVDKTSGLIQYDENTNNKCMVPMPYSMKLMIQELQTMGIATRIITENNITNKSIFNYLSENYYSGKGTDDIYDEDIPEGLYEDE